MIFIEHIIAFFVFLTISIIAFAFFYMIGFFHLPNQKSEEKKIISWRQVVAVFVVMMSVEIISAPFFYYMWTYFKEWRIPDFPPHALDPVQQGWLNMIAIFTTGAALLLYCLSLDKQVMNEVWGKGGVIRNYIIGASTWFIAYPVVAALGQLIALGLALFYLGPHVDQVAVKHLKNLMNSHWLFLITAIEIVTIVPVIEELLFRGFLQTWLKKKLGIFWAIIVTSTIFAFFHFSLSQGIDNIELISSLFVLACFLGFLRERQQSLWASIGLHSMFNLMSILFLTKILT